jgi:hypothetical protein
MGSLNPNGVTVLVYVKLKLWKASGLFICLLLTVFIISVVSAANYDKTFNIQAPSGLINRQYKLISHQSDLLSGLYNQKLYISITPSLYNYYVNMSHSINDDSDYAKFITPQAVEPIAESIQKITDKLPHSDEQFADAVLMMVHQIPYTITEPKYPVETLKDNTGDCVELSFLAASIMRAGGLDVVLIHYTGIDPEHMNVGVYLPNQPVYHTLTSPLTGFEYNNKTYWTAEATPAGNWKVGDQSEALAGASAVIIPVGNTEQSPPEQVSSSLNMSPLPSNITINLSEQPTNTTENDTRSLTISGSILPAFSEQNVIIYVSNDNGALDYFTAVTDNAGSYMSTWNFNSTGTYNITTSWSGDSNYAGADSETLTVFVGPQSFIQFQALDYNYIIGQPFTAGFVTLPMQGVNDFLSIPIGNNVSFSYDFIILPAGHTVSNVETATVEIPASQQTTRFRNQTITTVFPGETLTVPVNVPDDMTPLRLPEGFNQTLNNQFCFIVQKDNGDNFSLNIKALSDDDLANIATFTNASQNINDNTWYHTTTTLSDSGITSNLFTLNGTLVESTTANSTVNESKTVTLITNNQDNAVVLKDLKIENLNQTQQPSSPEKTTISNPILFPFIVLSILLAATLTSVFYIKRKKSCATKDTNY